jgi:hypothetical protein
MVPELTNQVFNMLCIKLKESLTLRKHSVPSCTYSLERQTILRDHHSQQFDLKSQQI